MKITISVGGRFHAFDLASQLSMRGALERLITAYPVFETVKYGIPREKIRSILFKEVALRFWEVMPPLVKHIYNPKFLICDLYDIVASRRVVESDIFVGWASCALRSMGVAKSLGAKTIVERGSSHIVFQDRILREEYEKCGIKVAGYQLPHPKLIEKGILEYMEADRIAVPSAFNKRTFIEMGVPKEKIIQVPYGVNLSAFREIPKEDSKFRVIFAGSMCVRKGVHYLLRAYAELRLPNSELMLLGAINQEIVPFLKKYKGCYNYVGKVSQGDLYKYYSQGSVFVIISIEEGLAMVQPQAMACGLPVIATTNTGGEDIVREGVDGFIIPIRDVDQLKVKLLYLYENPEVCRQMGSSAKERVSSGFTWDNYGEKIVSEYAKVLEGC